MVYLLNALVAGACLLNIINTYIQVKAENYMLALMSATLASIMMVEFFRNMV
jgi:hypothetical protein